MLDPRGQYRCYDMSPEVAVILDLLSNSWRGYPLLGSGGFQCLWVVQFYELPVPPQQLQKILLHAVANHRGALKLRRTPQHLVNNLHRNDEEFQMPVIDKMQLLKSSLQQDMHQPVAFSESCRAQGAEKAALASDLSSMAQHCQSFCGEM